jgi:hypothetical protein
MLHDNRLKLLVGTALLLTACSSASNNGGSRATRPGTGTARTGVSAAGSQAAAGSSGPLISSSSSSSSNPGSTLIGSSSPVTAGAPAEKLRDGQCARQDIGAMRIRPTVWLVIDGSGSMLQPLDIMNQMSPTRWNALREALMEPTMGLIKSIENDVDFGMVIYDGPLGGLGAILPPPAGGANTPPATSCPRVVSVEPAMANFAPINMAYPADPLGGSTPTDKALEAVLAHLPMGMDQGPDAMAVRPTIVVLATDGEPNDFCSMAFPPADVRPNVINAVKQLLAAQIKTYVISLAGSDTNLMQFCTDVAAAGGTGKPAYVPSTRDALVQAFREIIGPGVACDVHLTGMVKAGLHCSGKVELNGMTLACDNDNGWRLKDASTISLTGTACEKFKFDPQAFLHADFPCEAIMLN